ncbi:MAG: endonuclease/exonuclease/phosphatase family protein [Bacteroidia bacterium]
MPDSINIEPVPSRRQMSWFSRIIFALNWFAVAGLLLASIAPFVSPSTFWLLAFFALMHPVFTLLNLLFLIYWILRKRKQVFVSLAVLLLASPYYFLQFRLGFNHKTPAPDNSFSVMSYNVKLFDLYNWTGNKKTRSEIFNLLKNHQPDVLCLQEFYNEDFGDFRNLDTLKHLLQLPYAHTEYTITLRKDDHWGVATFSRFPIINQGKITFNNRTNNICIYTDIVKEKDTIRVYNMHLQSVSLGYADRSFVNKVKNMEEVEDEIESSKNILRRMKRAYIKRAGQARSIYEHISKCPYPVIVCGDFNEPPVSYVYNKISTNLHDAFLESGKGFGKTFDNPFPLPRIDYILHSKSFASWNFTVIDSEVLSDHFPVYCKISKK